MALWDYQNKTNKTFFFTWATATLPQQIRWVCGRGYLIGQPMVVEIVWETCLNLHLLMTLAQKSHLFTLRKGSEMDLFYLVFISGLFSAIYVSHYSCENNMWFINLRFGRESLTSLFYEVEFLMKPNPLLHFLVIFQTFSAGCPTVNSVLSVFLHL